MPDQQYSQEVFNGDRLQDYCTIVDSNPVFMLPGTGRAGQPMLMPVSESLLSRHMLLLGGIGTGKTNAFDFIIRNIRSTMQQNDVMVIFDTKGDFYREFYRPGDVVISNDERATNGKKMDFWNLFGEITIDGRTEENVLEISKTLFSDRLQNSSQPFFPNAAMDLFSAVLLHMLRTESMADVRDNMNLRSIFNSFSVPAMKKILMKYPDLKAMISYIDDEKSGQTLGVVAELQQLVREIFVGNFKKKGSLAMRRLIREKGGRAIFVEYDLGLGNMLTPVYKLLIDLAIKEALCRSANEGNVYFMIDEFRLVPNLQHIDDGVNFGRSLGAKFAVGIQNVDQISAAYGENLSRSILSGFGTTFAFRVNDANSREYIKNLYGRNIKIQNFVSRVQSRGLTEQIREGYVAEDSDITNLRVGEAIVGTMSCEPFRFRFPPYK